MGHADDDTEHAVAITALGDALGALRLAHEQAQRTMQHSLLRHGQLCALAACDTASHGLEVVDGFKRVRAAREIGWPTLRVRVVAHDSVAAKVALAELNAVHGLTALEEAWLVRSLYREDRQSQPAIARLLGRHKSWVCRRLVLAEGLDDAVQADVRLGLLCARAASALGRLPRGNQQAAADVVVRRGLTVHQTDRLVTAALEHADEAERARFLAAQLAASAPAAAPTAATRPHTEAEWIVADTAMLRRVAARLHTRLLASAPALLREHAGDVVVAALGDLAPVLASLHARISRITDERTSRAAAQP